MSLFTRMGGSYRTVRHDENGRKIPNWKGEDQFNTLLSEAKAFAQQKQYISALKKYIAAKQLSPIKQPQLITKIAQIKDKCWDHELDETQEAFQHVGASSKWYLNIVTDNYHINLNHDEDDTKNNAFDCTAFEYTLTADIYNKLYEYQRECVVWLYTIYKSPNGGILGDDMGLGKTVQMSAYLHGAFYSELIRCAMLIVPVSVISHWVKELKRWCKGIKVRVYSSSISTEEREENLSMIGNNGGILITTYGMIQRNYASMSMQHIRKNKKGKWDYMILDEGHIIKNHNIATSKAVREVQVRNSNKIILSGTFLQNELSELWSLFDFISEGNLFGTYEFFNQSFASKINVGRLKNATEDEKQVSVRLLNLIKKISAPYLLSRTKAGIRSRNNSVEPQDENSPANRKMLTCEKRELVVWIKLSDIQAQMYHVFLESDIVQQALNTSKSPLAALTVLKKICDHPFLLLNDNKMSNCHELDEIREQLTQDESIENTLWSSTKMDVLLQILEQLMDNKHRVLVFSQSRHILSMIGEILRANKVRYLHMDGETKVDDRQKYVNLFNKKVEIKVFLLSTKVGGLGLNLTGSDRVIIYDPAWNPAIDAQAVDRSYRIGQLNDVMVYRFVTCGTIEEKIYRRQISKVGLLKSVATDNSNQERYFTKHELNKEMLQLQDHRISKTQIQFKHLNETRKLNSKESAELDKETNYVDNINHVFGISHHDLLFKTSEFSG